MVDEKVNIDELLDNRRSFIGPDEETVYFIGVPSAEDIRGADWQYSKKYTKCLNEGIPTSAELSDILRRRGVIGEDFDRRADELSTILNELLLRLSEAQSDEDKAALAVEVSRAREALFQWNQRLSGPMSNTCEQISDDSRLEYLTACILQDKDSNKIWSNYEDFLTSKDQALTLKARYEVMLYLQGYDSDFLSNTPEALAMQEVQSNIISKLSEEVATEEVAPVEDKPKKKKTVTAKKSKTTKTKKDTKD